MSEMSERVHQRSERAERVNELSKRPSDLFKTRVSRVETVYKGMVLTGENEVFKL